MRLRGLTRLILMALFLVMTPAWCGDADLRAETGTGRYVFPAGQEEALTRFFNRDDFSWLDRERLQIQIEPEVIRADLHFRDGSPALRVTLRHPESADCTGSRSEVFCVESAWMGEPGERTRQETILARLLADTPEISWRRVGPPEGERVRAQADKEASPTPARLHGVKVLLLWLTGMSLLLVLVLGTRLGVTGFARLERSDRAALVFWGVYAFVIRRYLVAPIQHNAYADLPPGDWATQFPHLGATFPLVQELLIAAGLPGSGPVFALMILIGALSVSLLYLLARRMDLPQPVPHLAALLLAIVPFHVRLSAGDSSHIPLMLLFISAALVFRRVTEEPSRGALMFVAAACLLMIQLRPEAIAVAPVLLLFARRLRGLPLLTWPLMGLVGAGTILSFQVYAETGGFGHAVIEHPGFMVVGAVKELLFTLLGTGVWISADPWRWQYVTDSLLGAWPAVLTGGEIWRDAHVLQWTPAVLIPLYWLGLLRAIFTRRYLTLVFAIVLLRLPAYITSGLSGFYNGDLYFEARYFISVYPLQLMFVAFGGATLFDVAGRWRIPKALTGSALALFAFSVCGVCLWMYPFTFGYQDEVRGVREMLDDIRPNARVAYMGADAFGVPNYEASADLSQARLRSDRPDLTFFPLRFDAPMKQLEEADYYLDLLLCQIPVGDYRPYYQFIDGTPMWLQLQRDVARMKDTCDAIRTRLGEPLRVFSVRRIAFAGHFSIPPGHALLGLYEVGTPASEREGHHE